VRSLSVAPATVVASRWVLLVDDVTTGATLAACGEADPAGARAASAIAVARERPRWPGPGRAGPGRELPAYTEPDESPTRASIGLT
jgi:hypothetical protein